MWNKGYKGNVSLPQRVRHHSSMACTHTFSVSYACCFHGNLLIYINWLLSMYHHGYTVGKKRVSVRVCVCVCVCIYVLCTHALWGFQPKNYLISGLLVSCNGVQVVVGAAANAFTLLAPKLLHLQGFAGWLKGPYYCRPCKFKAESAVHLVSF